MRPSTVALSLVAALLAVNFWIAPVHLWRGAGEFHDLFGDFLKLSIAYPGGTIHPSNALGLHDLIAGYIADPHYDRSGVIFTDPSVSGLTVLHLAPMTQVMNQLERHAMTVVDPAWLFASMALLLEFYLIAVPFSAGRTVEEKLGLGALAAICFPNIWMLIRGNLNAGFACALIVHSVVLLAKERRPILAAILLALACNIRPNAIVFALPALWLTWPSMWRFGLTLAVSGIALLGTCLLAAHALYPDYTFDAWRLGLSVYARLSVVGNDGIPGGSALASPFKLWLGHPAGMLASLAVAGAIGVGALVCVRKVERSVVAFLTCAVYVTASTVIGDYHLAVFVAVPALASIEPRSWRGLAASVGAALVLAPKFYGQPLGYDAQVLLNPLLIVLFSIGLLASYALPFSNLVAGFPRVARAKGT